MPAEDDRHAGQRQPARRDARLQRRHADARRAEQLGVGRLGQLLPQLARSGASAEWRSRWPVPSARSRAPRCTGRRSRARHSSSSTPATRRAAARCSTSDSGTDAAGALHVPVGYNGETQRLRQRHGRPDHPRTRVRRATTTRSTNTIWGARANICIRFTTPCSRSAPSLGVFAQRPAYNANCTVASPVRRQRRLVRAGTALPGRGIPDRRRRVHLDPGRGVPVHLPARLPRTAGHARTRPRPCRRGCCRTCTRRSASSTGSAEDMLGYIFPSGNAVGIPTASNLEPILAPIASAAGTPMTRESTSAHVGQHRRRRAGAGARSPRRSGRADRPRPLRPALGHTLSRDPLGGPEIKCTTDQTFRLRRSGVRRAARQRTVVAPAAWMSLSGLPQRTPDRDTRGYFDAGGRRVWLDVFGAGL